MGKRMISLLLTVVMVLAVVSFSFAAEAEEGLSNFKKVNTYVSGQFSDVSSKQWYAANVQTAYELNLMQGKGDGKFGPTANISVIETIVTACRLHSIYYTGKSEFVNGSPWYQPYVDYAVRYGIIRAGEYSSYNAPATRAQFVSILAGAFPEEALPAINAISKGSIPDVPASMTFADAVYLMYNAGILVGNDDYGTFDPGGNITRVQAAAIITRMADSSLRLTKTLKVKDTDPPTGVTVRDVSGARWTYDTKEYYPGQSTQLDATLLPVQARSGITWTSSNPAVASVNESGKVEILKQGEAVITATAYNGVKGTFKIVVPYAEAQLQYALTADGKGYALTGCDADAYTVHIPATYKDLPVVSIREGAFIGCSNLRYFTVASDQAVFYEEGGVIFADLPDKTLVAFPPAYDLEYYYYAPEDTVAVADYAFAGLCNKYLVNITFREGLLRLGDCAFAENRNWNLIITMPESLTEIGEDLLKNYYSMAQFVCYEDSDFRWYAEANGLIGWFPESKTLDYPLSETTSPESLPYEQLIPADEKDILYLESYDNPLLSSTVLRVDQILDLSQWEKDHDGEIRMRLERRWLEIMLDVNGNTELPYSPQTGLYGAGRTEGEAILRGYDMEGNLIAMQYISGDFAFSFPGAYDLGVEGGTDTHLTVIPVEPTYITAGGNFEIDLETWGDRLDGNVFEYYIAQVSNPTVEFDAPSLQRVNWSVWDAATGLPSGYLDEAFGIGYQIFYFHSTDPSVAQGLDGCVLSFGGMKTVLDTDRLECMFIEDFSKPEELAKNLQTLLGQVEEFMLGTYVPASISLQKVIVCGDGSTRASASPNGMIRCGVQDQMATFAHEMVHAVDYNVPAAHKVQPAAWAEGRAEYISYKICEAYGYEYENIHLDFDWSFLTKDDKADFFRYYYFCKDEITEYDIGYHFLCYLNETYGEDISCRIMENLAALTEWDSMQRSEANAVLFKQCVEAATEVGVFQNFVRDVIEK